MAQPPGRHPATRLGGTWTLALLVGLGCESPPPGPGPAGDQYETCTEPAARNALESARERVAAGDQAGALPHLQRALDACPDHVRSHILYQDISRALGDGAAVRMREYYAAWGDSGSAVWPYTQARLAAGDGNREDLLREALRRDPRFYWAYLSLGRMLRDLRNTAQATEMLRKALSGRPEFAEARLELAEILAGLGRYEEAEVEYANYLNARPNDREVQEHYVRLLIYDLGRLEDAIPLVHAMHDRDPEDVDVLMNMAALSWNANQPETAIARYHRVLELDATEARAVLNLGNLYYEKMASDPASRAENWPKARKAYLYYLNMRRTEGIYDFADHHFAVPYRLRKIEKELGPGDGRSPTLADF